MLQTIDLTKEYRGREVSYVALSNININIERGDYVSFYGPSGSGKTTLLNILGVLDKPTSGALFFNGKSLANVDDKQRLEYRRGKIGYLFSDAKLIDELTIFENVELPLLYSKETRKNRKELVYEVLGAMNILHRKDSFPNELTAVQQQKVSIARAIVTKPLLLIADEPTGNLNTIDGDEILRVLNDINESGTTLLVFTHALVVAQKGQRIVQMIDGHLVSDHTVK